MKAAPSVLLDDLRGKEGNVAFTKGRSGLVVRPLTHPRDPETPRQLAIRANLARAAQAYRALTPAELAAWRAYATSVTRTSPVQGTTYHPCANTAFMALAAKFLQVNPAAPVPTTPPETAFAGDTITLTASAVEPLSPLGEDFEESRVPCPGSSKSPDPACPWPGGGGPSSSLQITFTASAPNAPGVITELLLQPLPSPNRTPHARRYRTVAFHTFTDSLTFAVPVEAEGPYAAAYRFVSPTTGQSAPLFTLPDVVIVTRDHATLIVTAA